MLDNQINHNKLSVKPLLEFNFDFNYHDNELGVSISNKGLGPGKIVKLSLNYKGDPFPVVIESFRQFYEKVNPKSPKLYYLDQLEDVFILPGQTVDIFTVPKVYRTEYSMIEWLLVVVDLDFCVDYCSAYGEETDSIKLKHKNTAQHYIKQLEHAIKEYRTDHGLKT